MRLMIRILTALLFAVALPSCSTAAEPPIVPSRLAEALAKAHPGDTITLAPGDYGDVVLPRADHRPAVTVDASQARLRSLRIAKTAGWVWRGGIIDGALPPAQSFDVTIGAAKRIEIAKVTLTGSKVGVTVSHGSEDIVLRDNLATGLLSDGFNVNWARRVSLIGNTCRDFKPLLPVYDAAGKQLSAGTHNDCVQLWSVEGQEPTSDITITGTTARGYMQGIGQYNRGGLIRNLTVRDNDMEISFWNGIAFSNVEGADIRNNRVRSVAGAKAQRFPHQPIRTWIIVKGTGVTLCGNTAPDMRGDRRNADPEIACH